MVDHMAAHPDLRGTGGNVTIILRGGTVGTVYGGCDVNGNVEGRITIIVDSTGDACPLDVNTIYGGGNLAPYTPDSASTNPNYNFPLIDLRNGHVNRNVYGGGRGSLASTTNGTVTSNPYVHMHPDVNSGKKFRVLGSLLGGGELGPVNGNTTVLIENGLVKGSVYGGGKGDVAHEDFGIVKKNTWVDMQGGQVERSIYGGGELGSVGTWTATYAAGESPLHIEGEPKTCQAGTGVAKITISGNSMVGVLDKAIMPPPDPEEDDYGYIFCGSRGEVDSIHYATANKLAVVDSTYLEIGGEALVTSSAYGGCENGQVLRNTYVKITGNSQIGVGYHKETTSSTPSRPLRNGQAGTPPTSTRSPTGPIALPSTYMMPTPNTTAIMTTVTPSPPTAATPMPPTATASTATSSAAARATMPLSPARKCRQAPGATRQAV